jgi:hypothetical protein
VDASLVEEVAPNARVGRSDVPRCDLGDALGLTATDPSHALLVRDAGCASWLLVEPGTRFEWIAHDTLRPLPAWLRDLQAPVCALAQVTEDGRFGYELDLPRLLGRTHESLG